MIRSLTGHVIDTWSDGIVLQCGPVALELYMAHHQSMELMEDNLHLDDVLNAVTVPVVVEIVQTPSKIHFHTVAFMDEPSRKLYQALREVPKVGRKSALAALESGSWKDPLRAAQSGDERWLRGLEGIGPAKAKEIANHLRAKYEGLLPPALPVPLNEWISAREDLMASHDLTLDSAEDLLMKELARS